MVEMLKQSHGQMLEMPWSRRKRLITSHVELERVRAAKREESMRAARRRR